MCKMISVILFFVSISFIFCQKSECPSNEQYLNCGTSCPRICRKPPASNCTSDKCVSGCFCKEGFVRAVKGGKCIPVSKCKAFQKRRNNSDFCDVNEIFSTCASDCPRTCIQSSPQPPRCPLICREGCVCKEGYLRINREGVCIPENTCFAACRKNQEFLDCGSACPPKCGQPNIKSCPKMCIRGCFCKNGYLLDEQSGECVPSANCQIN